MHYIVWADRCRVGLRFLIRRDVLRPHRRDFEVLFSQVRNTKYQVVVASIGRAACHARRANGTEYMRIHFPPLVPAEIELRRGRLIARLRPDIGGSISGFWYLQAHVALPVLRPAVIDARDALEMASFPLVPFCNRVEHGRFLWQGREVYLPPNDPADQFVLHGYGWKAAWRVIAQDAQSAHLDWLHEEGIWPWRFAATQNVTLGPDGLHVELSVTNLSETAMPAALGHHPYFPLSPHTLLEADVGGKWETDTRLIPTHYSEVAYGQIFGSARTPHGRPLDNTFTQWRQPACIHQPHWDMRVELAAEPQHSHLAVFVPPSNAFFCVEPVMNIPDALNALPEHSGITALAPGERLRSLMIIKPRVAADARVTAAT